LFFQNEKKQNELIAKNNFEKVNQEKMELMGEYNDKKADLAKKINEIRDIKNENDELIKDLEKKNKKIKDLENQIRSDLIGKDNTIANLKKELNSKIETIANLDNQINELKKKFKIKNK
jgi:chromosome segregation ATPase